MVELEAAREQELELGRLADDDQRAEVAADDVVDPVAQLGTRRDTPERVHERRFAAGIVDHVLAFYGRSARSLKRHKVTGAGGCQPGVADLRGEVQVARRSGARG